jgi:hypothetical protein
MSDARDRLRAALLGLTSIPLLLLVSSAALQGCGSDISDAGSDGGTDGGVPEVVTLFPNAPPLPGASECKVVRTTGIQVGGAVHLATCTPIKYATNPPSGGDHWGIWAAYKAYTKPVPRESYVHDLEHGAVVLTYRCESDCADVVKMLEKVRAEAKPDSLCLSSAGGPAARIVLTPDPLLDTPIAASAWGATYTATCIDEASLAKFVADVYGKGTEATCYNGNDWDDPDAGLPTCDGSTGN